MIAAAMSAGRALAKRRNNRYSTATRKTQPHASSAIPGWSAESGCQTVR